jgi:hypothetical protein
MVKKLSLLMAAMAVLAFAVPALASAKPVVTKSAGVLANTGEKFTGTGSDVILNSSTLSEITCNKLNLVGTLSKNNTSEGVAGASNGEFTAAECRNRTGVFNFTAFRRTSITATGSPAANSVLASFEATVDVGATECKFTGTNIAGTFAAGKNTITFTGASGVKGGGCGTATLTGTFALEIGTTAVIFDE